MLYYLFRFLEEYGISGSHMWGYISFRALLALIFSLVISAWFGEKFIKYLKSKQITETQRDASIDPFGTKKIGVPSMGGIIIIVSHPCIIARTTQKHLPIADDYHHSMAWLPWWNGRFHQDIPS